MPNSRSGYRLHPEIGTALQHWMTVSPMWVHRRIDNVTLVDYDDAMRRVSIDVTVPDDPRFEVVNPQGAREHLLILGALPKSVTRQLSAWGPDGLPLLIADSSVTGLMAEELLKAELITFGPTKNIPLASKIAFDRAGSYRAEASRLLHDDAWKLSKARATTFADSFLLAAFIPTELRGRHLIFKYSHFDSTPSLASKAGKLKRLVERTKMAMLGVPQSLGILATQLDIPTGSNLLVPAAYHLEVAPPEPLRAEALAFLEPSSGGPASPAGKDDHYGSVAHVVCHYGFGDPTNEVARLRVRVPGASNILQASLIGSLALRASARGITSGVEPTVVASVYLALAVGALVLSSSRRQHRLVTHVRQPQAVLSLIVGATLVAAAVAAAGSASSISQWLLLSVHVGVWINLAILLAALLGFTVDWVARNQPFGWSPARAWLGSKPPNNFSPNVAIIGDVCVDENTINGTSTRGWGSAALFIADYFARQGIKAQIFAPHAPDLNVSRGLFDFALDVSAGEQSMRFENKIEGSSGRQQRCTQIGPRWPSETNALLASIAESTLLLWCPLVPPKDEFTNGLLIPALRMPPGRPGDARLRVGVVQGVGRLNCGTDNLIESGPMPLDEPYWGLLDLVVFSDEDFRDNATSIKDASQRHPGTCFVMTRSDQGATMFVNGTTSDFPTISVEGSSVRNPIGAGDVFAASLALECAAGMARARRAMSLNSTEALIASVRDAIEGANQAAYAFISRSPEHLPVLAP